MLTPENLENRKTIIGGSDAGAILNLPDAFGNAFDVYQRLKTQKKLEKTPQMLFGEWAEDFLRYTYEQRFKTIAHKEKETLYHPEHKFIGGHIDGWAWHDGLYNIAEGTPKILLEFKTADSRRGDWGEEYSSDILLTYLAQAYHYMSLDKSFIKAHVFVLFTNTLLTDQWELKLYEIPRNESLITAVVNAEVEFWNAYVVPDIAPPAIGCEQLRQKFPVSDGATIETDHVRWEQYLQLCSVRDSLAALEAEETHLKSLLMETMQEAEILKFHGKTLATWKNHEREYFDAGAFRKANPEICSPYVSKKTQRTFLTKKLGK